MKLFQLRALNLGEDSQIVNERRLKSQFLGSLEQFSVANLMPPLPLTLPSPAAGHPDSHECSNVITTISIAIPSFSRSLSEISWHEIERQHTFPEICNRVSAHNV